MGLRAAEHHPHTSISECAALISEMGHVQISGNHTFQCTSNGRRAIVIAAGFLQVLVSDTAFRLFFKASDQQRQATSNALVSHPAALFVHLC